MATHARPDLLARTLESVFTRNHPGNWDVVVVEDGFDDGATRYECKRWGHVRYFCRRNRPEVPHSNAAVPLNIGIRQARGEVLILQSDDCMHMTEGMVEKLTAPHREQDNLAIFAMCKAFNQGEDPYGETGWISYCDSQYRRRPLFFCGSIRREHLVAIRGYDEDFPYYGSEDGDLAVRLERLGVQFQWRDDLIVHHQWHPWRWNLPGTNQENEHTQATRAIYQAKQEAFQKGEIGVERNLGREWGKL